MPTTSINLGQVAAVISSPTAPTNTNVMWLNTSGSTIVKMVWDPIGLQWIPFTQAATVAGDNWGTQVVVTDSTLAGTGILASPLKLAPQGATSGQVLVFNGTTWLPENPFSGGLTSIAHDTSLQGDGTTGSPLGVKVGTAVGQVLTWNGTIWAPAGLNNSGLVQPGMILMWSGLIGNIPSGWALCNGSGTLSNGGLIPNLSGMFIVGYNATDSNYNAIGNTGGLKTNALTAAQNGPHVHGVNDSGHTHNVVQGTDSKGGSAGTLVLSTGNIFGNFNTVSANAFTGITLQSSGTGAPIENRPPYYTLAYIIKL